MQSLGLFAVQPDVFKEFLNEKLEIPVSGKESVTNPFLARETRAHTSKNGGLKEAFSQESYRKTKYV